MRKKNKAFTLLEILLVSGLIAIVAGIVIYAINPARQLAQARNATREADSRTILDAISQYVIDHQTTPPGIDDSLRMVGESTSGCEIKCGTTIVASANLTFWEKIASKAKGFWTKQHIPSALAATSTTGWVLPTSYELPGGQWTNVPGAYDNNTGTYATNEYGGTGWGQFVVLNLSAPIISNRLRVHADYLDAQIQEVDVDVYKDGVWVDVFQGGSEALWNCKWVELTYPQGSVEKARFRYNYRTGGYYFWLYELQFYKTAATITTPVCQAEAATSIQQTAAIMHGRVADDGGEPNEYRFRYGLTTAYGTDTSWGGGEITDDVFSQMVSGLTGYTTYHYQAQLRNSAGTVSCPDSTFTTKLVDTGWVLPTGNSDPSNTWDDEWDAHDDTTMTYARTYHPINSAQWSSFIYLTHAAFPANSLKFYARGLPEVSVVDVDVYRDGSWVDVYEGAFSDKVWVEKTFDEGLVSQARVRFYTPYANHGFFFELYDFAFQKSSETSDEACLNLKPFLVPLYIADIPTDPQGGNALKTYYAVKKDYANNRVMVYACNAELEEDINVKR